MSVIQRRLARVREELRRRGLDGLLVSQPESRFYLSGFAGHDSPPRDAAGFLLIGQDAQLLLTDPRSVEMASAQAPGFEIVTYPTVRRFAPAVVEAARQRGMRRVGFEEEQLPVASLEELKAAANDAVVWLPASDLIAALRVTKDATEIAAVQRAVDVADRAFARVMRWIRPGLTEHQVAWELERAMRELGASGVSFPCTVASGPNSSRPHPGAPSQRQIQEGEPITLDFGCVVDGYMSDITRTICLGEVPARLREVYDLVLRANEAAERGIRPGMRVREADAIARDLISAAGYGEAFGHGLGHGVGLAIHEPPTVSRYGPEKEILQPGMIFSIEPGVYLPGWGGVRIEDLVVLEDDGVRVLTRAPKVCAHAEILRQLGG